MTDGLSDKQRHNWNRGLGCVLGAALGDATGGVAFDEFGEFGMATQLSVLEARGLIEAECQLEASRPIIYDLFQEWIARSSSPEPTFAAALRDPRGLNGAAERALGGREDGMRDNSCITRSSFAAVRHRTDSPVVGRADIPRRLGSITHGDVAATEARVALHCLIRSQLRDPPPGFEDKHMTVRMHWLAREYKVQALSLIRGEEHVESPNSEAWGCLQDAVKAVRDTDNFEDCIRTALDFEGDTRAVATVAGAIAGMRYGADSIPTQWVEQLRGTVLGVPYDAGSLGDLLRELLNVPAEATPQDLMHEILIAYDAGEELSDAQRRWFERFEADVRHQFPPNGGQ